MTKPARFGVDPKLTSILGSTYSSSEKALCELVDNAWDADASQVWVILPKPMTKDPIIIKDDGVGMTNREVLEIYLKIANDRLSRSKDSRTSGRRRLVKGRKGIGKFAGLAAAHTMQLETRSRGVLTGLSINKKHLLAAHRSNDLEKIDLPFMTEQIEKSDHGTTITLTDLDQSKEFPSPDILRRLLVREYSRAADFQVFVNEVPLTVSDLGGETKTENFNHPEIGPVTVRWTISEKPLPKSEAGFVYRVGGKVVGRPTFCGLDEEEDLPEKVRNRIWGEIEADGLDSHVTSDWGEIFQNSLPLKEVKTTAREVVSSHIREVCKTEVNAAKARLAKTVKARIETLPEHRRQYAAEAVERVIQKYFPEGDDKVRLLVGLVLDALERDEYFVICEKIATAAGADVATIAECLAEFGIVDMAVMTKQARNRLHVLDEFERMVRDKSTIEADVHHALEHNLWVIGPRYSVIASNKTLKAIIDDYFTKGGKKSRAKNRPDLFLGQSVDGRKLLIEFKRPSDSVGRDAEAQVKKYRDDLTPSHGPIDIVILGGAVDSSLAREYQSDTQFRTYMSLIGDARNQLEWLLRELAP
jgi:Histidine kinase-, DNA gyrase B-, and HSP90-like ATPase